MVRTKRPQDPQRPRLLLVCEPSSSLAQSPASLRDQGYEVRQVASTYRAIVEQAKWPADVVLVDVVPLLDRDMEVFEVLRSARPGAFLLASLPASARDKARRALQSGADAYVVEPFEPAEVTLLLARSRARRASAGQTRPFGERLDTLARFAAGVAHEINNPLTTISGWLQLGISDLEAHAPDRQTLEAMHEEVERIAGVVRNLLCFAGEPPAHEEPVNVNDLLQDLLASCERQGVGIAVDFDEELPLILANREQIRLAFQQVVGRAMRGIVHEGVLEVRTRPLEGEDAIVVEVADNGSGIPAEALASVFDPFSRAGDRGAGLGLSAAYGIVQGHGGTIDVTSREGEGTRFTLCLPLHRLRQRNRILHYATG